MPGMIPKPTHVYIGTKLCGCRVAMTSAHPDWAKDTGQAVGDMAKAGLFIHTLTWEQYEAERLSFMECPHIVQDEKDQLSLDLTL